MAHYSLWEHLHDIHGLTLLESDLQEIEMLASRKPLQALFDELMQAFPVESNLVPRYAYFQFIEKLAMKYGITPAANE